MDQIALVNEQIEDGKQCLERLSEAGLTVAAACWIKESDSSHWHLHIVSSLVGKRGEKELAYQRLHALMRQMPAPFRIGPFDVRIERPNGPLGKAMRELIRHSKGRLPMTLGSCGLGGLSIDAGYVYAPISAPVQERSAIE